MSKNNRGGARDGAGAKLKYGEPTTPLSFVVPASLREEIKGKVYLMLREYEMDAYRRKILQRTEPRCK